MLKKSGLIPKQSDETFLTPFPILQMKYLEHMRKPAKMEQCHIISIEPKRCEKYKYRYYANVVQIDTNQSI